MMAWREKRRGKLSRKGMLASTPRLNPRVRWKTLDSGRMLVAYEKAGKRPAMWMRKLFAVPDVTELLLDDIGSKVVGQIDGTHTVSDLIAFVAREFKLSRKESEVALLKYMDMLGRRSLVGFEVARADPTE
ncbi:MAG: PqqD family peptide modification chaperone [Nitrospiraceae bacterium]|nr:PqqD family peptide modification chaperone [Nitrospiraceae bacterium]